MTCIGGVVYNCGLPPLPPPVNYPPRPQHPPQQPPKQPLPNPPPPRARVETRYYLSFPLLVGTNVTVVWDNIWSVHLFPSPNPVALQWQYYPNRSSRPRILASTTNPFIDTFLRPYVDYRGRVAVGIDPLPTRYPADIIQLRYFKQRWVVVCHEVSFPNVSLPSGNATPDEFRSILQNRKEKLVELYDTEFSGFGSFTYRDLIMHLAPAEVYIQHAFAVLPNIYIRPFDNNAYCMLIDPIRGGFRL